MKSSEKISHVGQVVSVLEDAIEVNIISESACAACHAKGMCTMADTKEKTITIPKTNESFQVGEQVFVTLRTGLGLNAVWWAYIFPLLLLLLTLLSLPRIHVSEGLSALLALLAAALYYVLLWRFRDKFKEKFVFEAEKLN